MKVVDLKKAYDEWNHQKLTLEEFDTFIEITTPFVDMNHDFIQLYLTKEQDGNFKITDDGYTISELSMLGIDLKSSQKRNEFFKMTLKVFGVIYEENSDELYININSISEYPEKQHRLIQCILRVTDMLLTSRNTVISIFTDEILDYFKENDIPYTDGASYLGVSGNAQTFDFTLPKIKDRKEKLIKAINNPTPDSHVQPLFAWLDIKDVRENSELIVLANDVNRGITEEFLQPFKNYHVDVLRWSKREEWIEQFKIS